jgi:hypothetical protein
LWQLSQLAMETPLSDLYGMWLAVTPSAGGNAPLWQVEHWLATGAWVWFQLLGFQLAVVWQLMQLALVGMCVALLPVAELPLWQLEQLVDALNRLWSGLEPAQVLVDLWQLSQLPVTDAWIAVAGLPVAP